MARTRGKNQTAGGALIGAITVAVSLLVRAHYGPQAQLCTSGFGAIGQAFSTSLSTKCQIVTTLVDFTKATIFIGAGMVVLGLIGFARAAYKGVSAPARRPTSSSSSGPPRVVPPTSGTAQQDLPPQSGSSE